MNVDSLKIQVGNKLFYFTTSWETIFSSYPFTTGQQSIKSDVAIQRKEQNILDQRLATAETDLTSMVQKQSEVEASVSGIELGKIVNILC